MVYSLSAVYCIQPVCFTARVLMLPIETLHLQADRFTDVFNSIFYSHKNVPKTLKFINTAEQSVNRKSFCVKKKKENKKWVDLCIF